MPTTRPTRKASTSLPPTHSILNQNVVDYLQKLIDKPRSDPTRLRGVVFFFEKDDSRIYAAPGYGMKVLGYIGARTKGKSVTATRIIRAETALSIIYKNKNAQIAAWLYSSGRHSGSTALMARSPSRKRRPGQQRRPD